jgi:hypothetical protein
VALDTPDFFLGVALNQPLVPVIAVADVTAAVNLLETKGIVPAGV